MLDVWVGFGLGVVAVVADRAFADELSDERASLITHVQADITVQCGFGTAGSGPGEAAGVMSTTTIK